ncbi:hypothetical protein [uncultured Porphyromonas sp.]|uniref:InlB B-repeat-containing protein n=1 Tax=uncultured Porphyromonas sp. TaxID=159274 RepID=UPI0026332E23|nr:hypothetical protein [uncultured Porphyromonas sp.]
MKRTIKTLSLVLASLSALLFASSCEDDIKPQEQEVDFSVSCTPPQAHIEREGQMVTTQLLVTEQEVECPRPTKYSVSFTYDETVGTLLFLGKSVKSGASIPLASLTNLSLTYQAKELMGNKVKVTVTNDAPKAVSKEAAWSVTADDTYSVETSQEGQGELVVLGAKDLKRVPAGTKLMVTATPADGWELVALTANDIDILSSKTFEVTENTMVRATFTQKAPTTYAVTLVKEGEGEVVITGADDLTAVPAGTKLTVTAKPADGWELTVLTANGADVLPSESFVVYNPTEVKAVFTKKTFKTYPVTLTKEGDGKVEVSGADNLDAVKAGSKLTVTATPADGWEVKSITANGKDITADKTFVVNGDTEVKVTFFKVPWSRVIVHYDTKSVASLHLNGIPPRGSNGVSSITVRMGEKVKLSIKPKEGYRISFVRSNSKTIRPTKTTGNESEYLLDTSMSPAVDVTVVCVPKSVTVSYSETNGSQGRGTSVKFSTDDGKTWSTAVGGFPARFGQKVLIEVWYNRSGTKSFTGTINGSPLKFTYDSGQSTPPAVRYEGSFVINRLDPAVHISFTNAEFHSKE